MATIPTQTHQSSEKPAKTERRYTVSYVMVRRGELWVYLAGKDVPVRSDSLQVEPTIFSTVRQPDPRLL